MNPYPWNPSTVSNVRANQLDTKVSTKNAEIDSEIQALRGQVDRLTLGCQALWELLRDSGKFSEEQLEEKISEIDLRDGSLDGRMGATVVKCRSCSRNTNSRRASCVWCGHEVEREHIFEG